MTPGPGTSRYTAGYGSNSEDGNREIFHQLRHNILESINVLCTQLNIVFMPLIFKYFRLMMKHSKGSSLIGTKKTRSEINYLRIITMNLLCKEI